MTGLGDLRIYLSSKMRSIATVDLFCGYWMLYRIDWVTGISSFEAIDAEAVVDSYVTALAFEVRE